MNDAYAGGSLKPGYQGKGMIVYEPLSVLSLRQRLGRLRFACYQFGAALPEPGLVADAMTIDCHQSSFAAGEKRGAQQQDEQQCKEHQ